MPRVARAPLGTLRTLEPHRSRRLRGCASLLDANRSLRCVSLLNATRLDLSLDSKHREYFGLSLGLGLRSFLLLLGCCGCGASCWAFVGKLALRTLLAPSLLVERAQDVFLARGAFAFSFSLAFSAFALATPFAALTRGPSPRSSAHRRRLLAMYVRALVTFVA